MSHHPTSAFAYLAEPGAIAAWLAGCDPQAPLAIDTEFERQRTYFARLCLVQIACAERIALIDTLAVDDLTPLAGVLAAPGRCKLLHAARQDLEVLYHAGLVLGPPLVDTQVAAALAGFDEQIGYAELVRELLGVTLDKSQTRTDWRQRPLSERQLHYAADDVRHLAALDAALGERLAALGREAWLEEECRTLADPALYD
ncbi:MAG: ribonuclease D, partial [Gammaproteobacteria bacterium]